MAEAKVESKVHGLGHSRKRVEDARFLRGQGNYIDDFKLPGMLHLDIVRSPYAHAKIKAIHTENALATPGVLAVIDGPTLQKYNVHNMPTLMSDTQMVLPIDTVKYQYQEVAAVLATDRYTAADGVAAVEVDYEPLPVVVDPFKALEPGATKVRDDKESNHIWHWEWGDKDKTNQDFENAEVTVKENIYIPRIHVASIETCGCVAKWDATNTHLTLWMTSQAPHAIRTVVALITGHLGLSEEKIRIISPDIGGGFGGKVPAYPGYVIAVAASIVTARPSNGSRIAPRTSQRIHLGATTTSPRSWRAKKMGLLPRCASKRSLIMAIRTPPRSPRSFQPGCSTSAQARMISKARLLKWMACTQTSRPVALPIAVHSVSPKLSTRLSA
jgi:carbon-monoxide dehydrogenase large subunit